MLRHLAASRPTGRLLLQLQRTGHTTYAQQQPRRGIVVGIPREVKKDEYRCGGVPSMVDLLHTSGHKVLVEKGAGEGSGISDNEYAAAGATIVNSADALWGEADMIIKVKEPLLGEYPRMRKGQVIFTYFHLAASRELTEACKKSGSVCIAYETVEKSDGTLPLLVPMSEVAGRMAIQEGAKYLERPFEGRGLLLAGVPGVRPATVVIIGGGVVGLNSAKMALGLGANVYILDSNLRRLRYISDVLPAATSVYSTPLTVRSMLPEADLLIGAVLVPGAAAPKLISRADLKTMKPRAVFCDVAIDQGGIAETSKATTHTNPTYIVEQVNHYCVANIPGAVPATSTFALTNATTPYAVELAGKGWRRACRENPELLAGLNVVEGEVTYKAVADAFGLPHADPRQLL
eukprot:tig00000317_g24013.t1